MQIIANTTERLEIHTTNRGGRIFVLGLAAADVMLLLLRIAGGQEGDHGARVLPNTGNFGLFLSGVLFVMVSLFMPDRTMLLFDKEYRQVEIRHARWPLSPKIVRMPLDAVMNGTLFEDDGTLRLNAGRGWFATRSLGTMGETDKVVPVINAWLSQARRA